MEEIVKLEGKVETIIYRNDSNGFTVFEVQTEESDVINIQKGFFTAVGCVFDIQEGDDVKLSGTWVEHKAYGHQLKVEWYEKITPKDESSIERYLASGIINGIGPKTAKKIVELFGKDTLNIIENNPDELTKIKGISQEKAQNIGETFREQSGVRKLVMFLQKIGLSQTFVMKIYKKFGDTAEETINNNPYILADEIDGIGFKKADKIATQIGVSLTSPYRVKSGMRYILYQALMDGHTYLPEIKLVDLTAATLSVDGELAKESLIQLQLDGKVKIETFKEDASEIKAVYLVNYLRYENSTALMLKNLASYSFENHIDVDREINDIENDIGMEFASQQRQAIAESIKNGVVVITGGPGTGKTTTINAIIKIFKRKNMKVDLAAPTGRAAKRMTQATGVEAKTIHRLLEMGYSGEENSGDYTSFSKDESNQLETDVLIIDEMSMVDIFLMYSMLKAVANGTRLILVGDADQLPSVGAGNVLRDIINSNTVKVVKLDEIFRQAQQSLIILNAHKINLGEQPDLTSKDKDFFFIPVKNPQDLGILVCELLKQRLPAYKNYNPFCDIQLIAPMKKGASGVFQLNTKLQHSLNPKNENKPEIQYGDIIFRKGDKVMQIKNNYDMEWKIKNKPLTTGTGVFNGDMGIIYDVDLDACTLSVLFDDDKIVEYRKSEFEEIELAYAITIHKSQGSEFKAVVIALPGGPTMIMNRNLLYTAVTRAKEMVIIVGSVECVNQMVSNNYQRTRYSGLDRKLNQAFESEI